LCDDDDDNNEIDDDDDDDDDVNVKDDVIDYKLVAIDIEAYAFLCILFITIYLHLFCTRYIYYFIYL